MTWQCAQVLSAQTLQRTLQHDVDPEMRPSGQVGNVGDEEHPLSQRSLEAELMETAKHVPLPEPSDDAMEPASQIVIPASKTVEINPDVEARSRDRDDSETTTFEIATPPASDDEKSDAGQTPESSPE